MCETQRGVVYSLCLWNHRQIKKQEPDRQAAMSLILTLCPRHSLHLVFKLVSSDEDGFPGSSPGWLFPRPKAEYHKVQTRGYFSLLANRIPSSIKNSVLNFMSSDDFTVQYVNSETLSSKSQKKKKLAIKNLQESPNSLTYQHPHQSFSQHCTFKS